MSQASFGTAKRVVGRRRNIRCEAEAMIGLPPGGRGTAPAVEGACGARVSLYFTQKTYGLYASHEAFSMPFPIAKCFFCVAQAPSVTASRDTFLPEEGLERVTAPKGAWDILRSIHGKGRKRPKKGAPINKIATRPFRSELLSFLLRPVEALYYALIHSGRLWSAQNMSVAEANRKENEDVYTKR